MSQLFTQTALIALLILNFLFFIALMHGTEIKKSLE